MFKNTIWKTRLHWLYVKAKIKKSLFKPPKANTISGHLNLLEGISLQGIVSRLPQGSCVVEIGSYLGRSSAFICEALPGKSQLVCIDIWENDTMKPKRQKDAFLKFKKNMAGYENKYTAIRGKSNEVVCTWQRPIDLLWIDGDHSYEACLSDLTRWFPHLKQGCWVVVHDYLHPCGVDRAVKEYLSDKISEYFFVKSTFYGRKS